MCRLLPAAFLALLLTGCALGGGYPGEESLLRIAAAAEDSRDFPLAARLYGEAAEKAVSREAELKALVGLGRSLLQLERQEEAIRAFKDALSRESESLEALIGLGSAYLAIDQAALAESEFGRALELDPANRRAAQGLAVAHDLSGQHEEAQRIYTRLLASAPNDLTLSSNLGLSLALSGDTARAVSVLEQVAFSPAADARHRQNLAVAYGLAGRDDKAQQLARMDLGTEAAARNLEYLRLLRQTKPGTGVRARSLQVNFAQQTVAAAPAAAAAPQSAAALLPAAGPAVTAAAPRATAAPASSRQAVKDIGPLSGTGGFLAASAGAGVPSEGPLQLALRSRTSPASASSPFRGFEVQLGAYASESLAERIWDRNAARADDLLRRREHYVVPFDRPGRSRLYRLRVGGFESQRSAASFCGALKQRALDCFVVPR